PPKTENSWRPIVYQLVQNTERHAWTTLPSPRSAEWDSSRQVVWGLTPCRIDCSWRHSHGIVPDATACRPHLRLFTTRKGPPPPPSSQRRPRFRSRPWDIHECLVFIRMIRLPAGDLSWMRSTGSGAASFYNCFTLAAYRTPRCSLGKPSPSHRRR